MSDIQARLRAEAAGAQGEEQIRLQLVAQLQSITMKERELGLDLPGERLKAEQEAAGKIKELHRTAAEETIQAEESAALAIIAPWDRSNAEIYVSSAQRLRGIQDLLDRHFITQADAARRTAAVWTEAAGKVLDEWSNAFEDLFNGGLSNRIEQNVKKFAARLAAQLTLQSGASGILAPILGLPAPGGPIGFGSTNLGGLMLGGGLPIPGMTGTFGGSTMAAASGFPLLATPGSGATMAGGSIAVSP